jgi:hypothetical protein
MYPQFTLWKARGYGVVEAALELKVRFGVASPVGRPEAQDAAADLTFSATIDSRQ